MCASGCVTPAKCWERIADYVDEVRHARFWGGIHCRHSTEVGERMGRAIGRLTVENTLQPAP